MARESGLHDLTDMISQLDTRLAGADARLRAYLGDAPGNVMDEPATAQALASVLASGLRCGALEETEVVDAAGADAGTIMGLATRRVGQEQ